MSRIPEFKKNIAIAFWSVVVLEIKTLKNFFQVVLRLQCYSYGKTPQETPYPILSQYVMILLIK